MVIDGQAAVITGAGRGIGRAIALALASGGANVSLAGRNMEELAKVKGEIEAQRRDCLVVQTDVTKQDQIESMIDKTVKRFGKLDILVNNAGSIILKSFLETTIDEYRQQMDIHYIAAVIACQAAVPLMQKQGSGKIVNISSIAGTVGYGYHSAYSPSKGAMIRFSEAIAQELKKDHINVNCIAPNAVDTNLFDDWMTESQLIQDRSEWIKPAEVGELALYLCSPAARSITGETIILQGIYEA
jgi:NAD(P)-dependent dehydrogenase (short-subunit alcohol dehydrogenase family)